MLQLIRYLKKYKKESVIGPLFKLLEASFELMIPIVMASIIDVGIANHDMNHVLKMGAVMVALGIIGLVCSITAQYYAAKAAVGFGTELRKDLYAHIHKLSYAELDTIGTSTLITRMSTDINQIQSGVNLVLRLFLRSPFIVIGAAVMAFTISVKAALIFVVAIPVLSVIVFGIMMASIPLYQKVQKQLDKVMLITRENLTGVRVVRSVSRQQEEIVRFQDTTDGLSRLQIFVGKISALMNPITYIIVNIALILLLHQGAIQVNTGVITQGEVIALTNYMSQILVELVKLANLIITLTKSLACANRINEVFAEQTSVEDICGEKSVGKKVIIKNETEDMRKKKSTEKPEIEGIDKSAGQTEIKEIDKSVEKSEIKGIDKSLEKSEIKRIDKSVEKSKIKEIDKSTYKVEFQNVDFTYKNAKEKSLENISFHVKKGELVGIIGGTGSGKSSLIQLLPRFYDVSRGAVLIDGKNVKDYPLETLRKKIGIVPQKAVLFAGTIADNLRFGKEDATEEEMMEALEIAQGREIVEKKKDGLNTMIEQGGANLSGGQRQRFTIARALVRKPEILILDDSASALDYATEAKLRKGLREKVKDSTVFIVSQRAMSIKDADQIIVLDDGKIAGIGSHKKLLKECEVYREICLSQLSKEEVDKA